MPLSKHTDMTTRCRPLEASVVPDPPSADSDSIAEPSPLLASKVLARLAGADVERGALQCRRRGQYLVFLSLAVVGLLTCGLPGASHVATHALAFAMATGIVWTVVVRVLLDGISFLPTLAAMCLLATGFLLWHGMIDPIR